MVNGYILLVDGGGDFIGACDVGARVVVLVLKVLGVDCVDVVVLTYLYLDYFGGLSAVLSHFQVAEVWTNGCVLDVSGVKSL